MVLNYIWIAFFLIAFVFGIVALLTGDMTIFQKMVDATFDSSKTAFETSLGLTGVLALWLGIMKVGEKAGIVNVLARMLSPFFTKLFPDIPKNHPVMGSIFMNIASNLQALTQVPKPIQPYVHPFCPLCAITAALQSNIPKYSAFCTALSSVPLQCTLATLLSPSYPFHYQT